MQRFIFSVIILFFGQSLLAQQHPQFFFQADKNQNVITPEVGYKSTSADAIGEDAVEFLQSDVSLSYEYGFMENLAVGARLSWTDLRTKTPGLTDDSAGLNDVELYVRSLTRFRFLNLRYGGVMSISPEASKANADGSSENRFTGANVITPYVGLDVPISSSTVGAKVSQGVLIGDRKLELTDGSKANLTGGTITQVDAFYEFNDTKNLYGAALSYIMTSDTEGDNGFTFENVQLYGARIYSTYQVATEWTLLPSIGYQTIADKSVNNSQVDKYDTLMFSLGVRGTF